MAFPWTPTMFGFWVASKWPSPPLKAGCDNPVDAFVQISHLDHAAPKGTQLIVVANTIGQPDINVALPPLPRDVIYVPANPGAGGVKLRWNFHPPVAGRWVFTYYGPDGMVRGIDFPKVQA